MLTMTALLVLAGGPGLELISNGDFAATTDGWTVPDSDACHAELIAAPPGAGKQALRLTLAPAAGADPWSLVLGQPLADTVPAGHHLRLAFWLRSPQGCRLGAYLEQSKDPWPKFVSLPAKGGEAWQRFEAEGVAPQTYAAGEAGLTIHLAYDRGVVELAGLSVTDLDAAAAPAHALAPVLANGDFADGLKGWTGPNALMSASVVPADVAGFKQAVRCDCHPANAANAWDARLAQTNSAAIAKGETVYWRAWMRSPDHCEVVFCWEQAGEPYTKDIERAVGLTPEWKEYCFAGTAHADFAPGASRLQWFLGQAHGTVEIAGVRAENYGRTHQTFAQTIDYWGGRAHDDAWRAAATARIEQLRKGDLVVTVLDAAGHPVPGAAVHVRQQRHLFRFGSAVPCRMLLGTSADAVKFQDLVARCYNTVTFENDLKWHDPDPKLDADIDQALAWCRDHGIQVRGHNLVWGSFNLLPPSVRNLNKDDLIAAINRRVDSMATRYRGRVYLWDVVNEAATNTEVWDKIGWEHFADVYRRAKAADPGALMCYNDYDILTDHAGPRAMRAKRIQYLIDHGAPLDVLGLQGHLGTPLVPMDRILALLDEWAKFGKRLEITEFDVGVEDDQVHGDYVRDILTAAFSEPAVDAFVMWGFWQRAHWRAKEGGYMVRANWTPRPAQTAWEDLVLHQWWTTWDGAAAADGAARTRAFYGRQKVTVEAGGKTAEAVVELAPGGAGAVTIRLP
jgi:GH35 family endo-1,4-beta-xylanase